MDNDRQDEIMSDPGVTAENLESTFEIHVSTIQKKGKETEMKKKRSKKKQYVYEDRLSDVVKEKKERKKKIGTLWHPI